MKVQIGGQQSVWILPYLICALVAGTAMSLDVYKIGTCLHLQYDVINHNPAYLNPPTPFSRPVLVHSFYARVLLNNTCETTLPNSGWSLVFCHKTLVEYLYFDLVKGDYMVPLTRGNMTLKNILGDTYSLTPNPKLFTALKKNQALNIIFQAKDESVSRYDVCLNWYITNGTHSAPLPITTHPDRLFVPSFNTIFKNTRNPPKDYVVPATPGFRFDMHRRNRTGDVIKLPTYDVKDMDILPIPLQQTTQPNAKKIPFRVQDWAVMTEDSNLSALKKYLEEVLPMLKKTPTANTNRIILKLRKVAANNQPEAEKYNLKVTAKSAMTPYNKVEIEGDDTSGVFYGIQSLLTSLPPSLDGSGTIQETDISDKPRYPYRGLRFDVASNFFPKATIFKLLKIMARLKMNKLQLIIANDYGVRVEIDGYEELTKVGGRRCHDLLENYCLMSQLGSDPNSYGAGSGYYSKKDYQDILKEADKHHIEIIPEYKFDDEMRATAKAMAVYEKKNNVKAWANVAFQPFKPNMLREGRMNPCNENTIKFFNDILGVFKKYHNLAGVPLKTFGIGGNFYSLEPWLVTCAPNYHPMDASAPKHPYVDIKVDLTEKLMEISKNHSVDLIGFEEYFLAFPTVCRKDCGTDQYTPFNTSRYDKRSPYTIHRNPSSFVGVPILEKHPDNVTDSIEERHTRYMQFKALGYKSIYSPDDALSLHNKDEHDPDIPGNIGSLAQPITNYGIHQLLPDGTCCNSYYCHPTSVCNDTAAGVDFKPNGMQAKIFTERIVSEKNLMELLFPRLIWAANKMWHKADWEDSYVQPTVGDNGQLQITTLANVRAKDAEFLKINTIISKKWLKILDDLHIFARITPPGIFFNASWPKQVDYFTALPGLILQVWQVDDVNRNGSWVDLKDAKPLQALIPRGHFFRLRTPFAKGRIDGAMGYSKPVLAYTNAQGNLYMNEIRQKLEELRITNQITFPIQHFYALSSENGIDAFRIMCNIPFTNGAPERSCGIFGNQTPRQLTGTQIPGGQTASGQIPNQQVTNSGTQNTGSQATGQRNLSGNPNNQAFNTAVRGGIPTSGAGSNFNSQTVG